MKRAERPQPTPKAGLLTVMMVVDCTLSKYARGGVKFLFRYPLLLNLDAVPGAKQNPAYSEEKKPRRSLVSSTILDCQL